MKAKYGEEDEVRCGATGTTIFLVWNTTLYTSLFRELGRGVGFGS